MRKMQGPTSLHTSPTPGGPGEPGPMTGLPFYAYRPMDMPLHPAFLPPFHPHPAVLGARPTTAESPNKGSKSFTIDAILGHREGTCEGKEEERETQEEYRCRRELLLRRQQRLNSVHPYLSGLTCPHPITFRPMPTTIAKGETTFT